MEKDKIKKIVDCLKICIETSIEHYDYGTIEDEQNRDKSFEDLQKFLKDFLKENKNE